MGGKKAFELMLEIGYRSQPLKAKLPNGYTHKWTVFVKGANNTKIEHCIQRVVFQLHDSFPNPNREVTEPPFQIKETGYAGFEIPIQIYFKNRDKPNHLSFTLDLVLLIDGPHSSVKNQKVSFYNPNREFEKCLIKTGAQMILMNKEKKDRSDSPPAKKQKSSSLIPSKDMAKQAAQTQAHSQVANTNHHNHAGSATTHLNSSHHHKSSHHSHHTNHNNSNHNNQAVRAVVGSNSNRTHNSLNHHDSWLKSSSSVSNNNRSHSTNNNHQDSSSKSSSHHNSSSAKPKIAPKEFIDVFGAPLVVNKQIAPQDPFQIIQDKISVLTDCDRLQRIVDIIEQSGEWYNLTASKFEFDLKRLDKKTLYKIEKCLKL